MAELVDDSSLPSPPLPPELAPGEGWALVRAPPLPPELAAGEGWALVRAPPLPPQLAPGEGWALVRAPLGMADTLEPLTMASDSYWCSCTFLQPAVFL